MAEISTTDVLAKEAHATNGVELSREGDVRALYRKLNELNRAAICLSGGGIRSASFAPANVFALGRDRVVPVHEAPGIRPLHLADNERAWALGCGHGGTAVDAAGGARLAPARAGVAACRRWLK
jgi:hypothetical protein